MLESRIVMQRTTVAADKRSLDTLKNEARRRGVPLTILLQEAVDEKADALRRSRRPRVGLGRSKDGRTAADVASEPIARPPA